MSYCHSLKHLIQGWWKQPQERKKKRERKKSRRSQSMWDTKRSLWPALPAARPRALPLCKLQDVGILHNCFLPLLLSLVIKTLKAPSSDCSAGWLALQPFLISHQESTGNLDLNLCIMPLELHSLAPDETYKGTRLFFWVAEKIIFQSPAPETAETWSSVYTTADKTHNRNVKGDSGGDYLSQIKKDYT